MEKSNLNIEKKPSDGYKEGAIAGGLVGIVIAAYMRKNIMIGAVIGLVGGGYIGYIATKEDTPRMNFKKQN